MRGLPDPTSRLVVSDDAQDRLGGAVPSPAASFLLTLVILPSLFWLVTLKRTTTYTGPEEWLMTNVIAPLHSWVQTHAYPLDLLLVDDGSKETRIEKHESPAEARRCHTDDGVGMLVHLSNAADDAAVILKMSVPIVVAKNDVRSAVGAMLIGGMEETAEVRLKAQHIEVVSAD